MGYGKLDRRRRDRYEVDQGLCVGYSNRVYWGRLEGMGLEADGGFGTGAEPGGDDLSIFTILMKRLRKKTA